MSRRLLLLGFCLLPLAAASEPSLSSEQERLLGEFRSCLEALPSQSTSAVVSPCAERDARLLSGITRAAFLAKLGFPDWCTSSKGQVLLWSEQTCTSARTWGYSFYRLAGVGGGPELQVTFSDRQLSTAVVWLHTQ
jgi:hypothetical protein